MFELMEFAKAQDLRGRCFPVVLEPEAIHDPVRILGHIQFGREDRRTRRGMKKVEGSNLEGVREKLDLYREIRATWPA